MCRNITIKFLWWAERETDRQTDRGKVWGEGGHLTQRRWPNPENPINNLLEGNSALGYVTWHCVATCDWPEARDSQGPSANAWRAVYTARSLRRHLFGVVPSWWIVTRAGSVSGAYDLETRAVFQVRGILLSREHLRDAKWFVLLDEVGEL